jgi:phenylalanyl-tRNA synthetase beta chain
MKISFNWLKEYLNFSQSVEEVAEILTDIGLEVEGVENYESIKGGLKGLLVGEVKSVTAHPNADKLQKTKIDVGHDELLDIVCGAPNVKEGQKVVVALVGTILYPDDKGFKIKKSKIRGEVSEGMLCAEDEIGLGSSHDGIMVLDSTAEVGTPIAEYFKVSQDTVFEIGLTPNRIDAASHFGVARDLAAYLKLEEELSLEKADVSAFKAETGQIETAISIQDATLCPRYSGVEVTGITVGESPDWLQDRLKTIGLKPINNVVDITNYVMHEYGQPLHAFDKDKIAGKQLKVQTVKEDSTFITLDEVERKLSAEDLMICDAEKPMCIAGVFGGIHSGVSQQTSAVFLESAYFNPVSVRKTAKRHGLNTDASFRFERGADPQQTIFALKRAALLIQELCGGKLSEVSDFYPEVLPNHLVEVRYDRINKLIGQVIPKPRVKTILENLDIKILNEEQGKLRVEVPAYRVDVQREVDIIEEILRIHGYNHVAIPEQMRSSITPRQEHSPNKVENIVANFLSSKGYAEIFNNSLSNPAYYPGEEEHLVKMLNPLSRETEVLRASMLFGGLETILYNVNRKRKDLRLYEFGKTYRFDREQSFEETSRLAIWLTGSKSAESWREEQQAYTFYDLKEIVASCLYRLGINKWGEEAVSSSIFQQGVSFIKGENVLVTLGKLVSNQDKVAELKQEVFFAEFNWDLVLELSGSKKIVYTPVSKYPSVRRDLALLLDKTIRFEEIVSIANNKERKLLKSTNLFDVYEGKNLPAGKKSYAVSFVFQDENKTLTDKHIDNIMDRLISAFKEDLKAELR